MLAIGDILQNRYRIVRQLGHGGMGTVYEAHDDRFETSVALKEVLIDLAKIADPTQQQMVARAFEREAKTLALLHHEAFPHVIDYFSESEHQYLIMELIRGEDLGEQLQRRKKPFEFNDVLDWTHQLLDALDYLHTQEQPIIHRDLKPQNMKLTARGKIKVLDFGIAKGADNKSSSTITNQTFVAATLNYSPIEQLLRVLDPTFREFISQRHKEKVEDILEHTADARSDLYSLGATLYQLLTATQPHDTLKRALDLWAGKPDPLPNPMDLNPDIPKYYNDLMLKAMEIDRDSRFVSADEMLRALKHQLDEESRREREGQQAAWIASQQQPQQQQPPPGPAIPDIGMQTQIRIAEEQKFLAELDGSPSPTGAKTEVLPPFIGGGQQKPVSTPPPPFIPPVDPAEERRRIAEQQKFLAELDSPAARPAAQNQAPAQAAALTDYGQMIPPGSLPSSDQTNYAVPGANASDQAVGDQTQVSYLPNMLGASQPAKAPAFDATVINPQIRNEAAQPHAAVAPAPDEKPQNKMLWLIPVAGVALLLVVGIAGFIGYKVFSGGNPQPSPTKTPYVVVDTTPTPSESPAATPDTATGNITNQSNPVFESTPSDSGARTAQTPPKGTQTSPREQRTPERQVAVDRPAPTPPRTTNTPPRTTSTKKPNVSLDDFDKKP